MCACCLSSRRDASCPRRKRARLVPGLYISYEGFVRPGAASLVLFYTGNESPVEEYVNNTGLMWEAGATLGATLVFAEHRYEGGSVPELVGLADCLAYATVEQALADYAAVIAAIRAERGDPSLAVVAVGGSYGGMLAGWLRMKYPHLVCGAVAASAPVLGFPLDARRSAPDDDSKRSKDSLEMWCLCKSAVGDWCLGVVGRSGRVLDTACCGLVLSSTLAAIDRGQIGDEGNLELRGTKRK